MLFERKLMKPLWNTALVDFPQQLCQSLEGLQQIERSTQVISSLQIQHTNVLNSRLGDWGINSSSKHGLHGLTGSAG